MASITEPSISLHYLLTAIIFVLMISLGYVLLKFVWNKGSAIIKQQTGATVPNIIIDVPTGNPMVPTQQ